MTVINELDSTCGISDEELTRRFKESIRIDNEIRKIKGLPEVMVFAGPNGSGKSTIKLTGIAEYLN